jgi:hypothetical protein
MSVAYCAVLLLGLPLAPRRVRVHYATHREAAAVTAARLCAAAAAPLWATRAAGLPLRQALSGGWLGRLPLLALVVRWPLHAFITLLSFLLTLPTGAPGLFSLRLAMVLLNVLIIAAFERVSRSHFLAARAATKRKLFKLA